MTENGSKFKSWFRTQSHQIDLVFSPLFSLPASSSRLSRAIPGRGKLSAYLLPEWAHNTYILQQQLLCGVVAEKHVAVYGLVYGTVPLSGFGWLWWLEVRVVDNVAKLYRVVSRGVLLLPCRLSGCRCSCCYATVDCFHFHFLMNSLIRPTRLKRRRAIHHQSRPTVILRKLSGRCLFSFR